MKLTLISDTHNKHYKLKPLPEADVLIHAGDATRYGEPEEIIEFGQWLGSQAQFKHIIFIPGNHDLGFEHNEEESRKLMPDNVHVLINEGMAIDGFNFYGVPYTPKFCRSFEWAFKYERYCGEPIWEQVPLNTDVLITHGPSYEKCDTVWTGDNEGCIDLAARIKKVKPKLHVCGHLHHGYGKDTNDETIFVNAAMCDDKYRIYRKPFVVDITK